MRVALDSNILFYAAHGDAGTKHGTAADLIERAAEADCIFLLQCLAEFYHAVTRKTDIQPQAAMDFVEEWLAVFAVAAADEASLVNALKASANHGLAFWDAMIWAVARRESCDLLLSEDFQDGRSLDGVLFVNPFLSGNAALIDSALQPAARR